MKLQQSELKQIRDFLDKKELFQIDLRAEIYDHIIESTCQNMRLNSVDFDEAFSVETQRWNIELDNYSSFWLGLYWNGPRIMISKSVKQIKKVYLKSTLASLFIVLTAFILNGIFSITFLDSISKIIGAVYIIFFVILLVYDYRIKTTDYQTTFSFLFKINAIGVGFVYVLYNPLWTNFMSIYDDGSLMYISIGLHAFAISFFFYFSSLYNSHMSFNNQKVLWH
ncbi:hypothetical protein [Maribacter dokdonensis]|uniref:hypothetical protein n=1 Tax=Maribacter dokdonensis TaxID=320912 RepID=UPI00327246BE|tara:strand:- start:137 stop:808 length:672 start_codon:yes stop_codon:yes gene_type:complete